MDLYHYDLDGLFVSRGPARPDPRDRNPDGTPKWIEPKNATLVPVPIFKPGEKPRFNKATNSWDVVEDLRGRFAWVKDTKAQKFVEALGPLDPTLTLIPPPDLLHKWDYERDQWVPDPLLLLEQARTERALMLQKVDRIVRKHASEKTLVAAGQLTAATLTDAKIVEWEAYAQALRDFTQDWVPGKPWPKEPE